MQYNNTDTKNKVRHIFRAVGYHYVVLLYTLRQMFPNATIHGHRDFATKECPCFDATKEYEGLK